MDFLIPEQRMCDVCCVPLNGYRGLTFGDVSYRHPDWEGVTWDHDAAPVPVDPQRLASICDFCSSGRTVTAFETVKAIVMIQGPYTNVFSDPWDACERCAVHIRRRTLHLLLDRVVAVLPGDLNRPQRRERRRELKALYVKFFAAEPIEIGKR
ncbi:hypothetical protein OG393_29105 [Streptomyces sp. NBC_01216]|uniref:hypothetical protein n=1 Tax=Streptomyces sp. NBC_01216 TaxID=2903778 RepID=UPI002E16247F|nr:hypothetical protein OG393_29105 [Streptomyces sp. NBC_01216]